MSRKVQKTKEPSSARPTRRASGGRAYGGRTAAERVSARRSAFVDAGLQLFGTRLYHEVTVADIVQTSGQTRRAFYELFIDREDLLRTVEETAVTQRVIALVASATDTTPPDLPSAQRLLDTILDFYAEDPRRAHVAFVAVVGVSTEMERHRRQAFHALAEAFSGLLGNQPGHTPTSARQAAIAYLGAFSELLIDHYWTQQGSYDDIRAELRTLLKARFFPDARTAN